MVLPINNHYRNNQSSQTITTTTTSNSTAQQNDTDRDLEFRLLEHDVRVINDNYENQRITPINQEEIRNNNNIFDESLDDSLIENRKENTRNKPKITELDDTDTDNNNNNITSNLIIDDEQPAIKNDQDDKFLLLQQKIKKSLYIGTKIGQKVRQTINLSTVECESVNKKIEKSTGLIAELITENEKRKKRPILKIGLISAGGILFFGYTLYKGIVPLNILFPVNSFLSKILDNNNNNNNHQMREITDTPSTPPQIIIVHTPTAPSTPNPGGSPDDMGEMALVMTVYNILKWVVKKLIIKKK